MKMKMRVQKTLSSHVLLSSFLLRSNRTASINLVPWAARTSSFTAVRTSPPVATLAPIPLLIWILIGQKITRFEFNWLAKKYGCSKYWWNGTLECNTRSKDLQKRTPDRTLVSLVEYHMIPTSFPEPHYGLSLIWSLNEAVDPTNLVPTSYPRPQQVL